MTLPDPGPNAHPPGNVDDVATDIERRWRGLDESLALRLEPIRWRTTQRLWEQAQGARGDLRSALLQRWSHHVGELERSLRKHDSHAHHEETAKAGRTASSVQALVAPSGTPLASLEPMRQTHARLKIRQQLRHSMAQPLRHAGPLHSERLVQQTLTRLSQWSETYLHRLMSYVDALVTLDDAQQLVRHTHPKAKSRGKLKASSTTKR